MRPYIRKTWFYFLSLICWARKYWYTTRCCRAILFLCLFCLRVSILYVTCLILGFFHHTHIHPFSLYLQNNIRRICFLFRDCVCIGVSVCNSAQTNKSSDWYFRIENHRQPSISICTISSKIQFVDLIVQSSYDLRTIFLIYIYL